jgi:ABC-type branched-subunit amino acid transport system substrate-binding protein
MRSHTFDLATIRLAGVIAAGALLAPGCGPNDGDGDGELKTIVLGAVIDRSGSQAWPGWVEAIRLAESHANRALAESRYKNLQLRVSITDSANDPAVALPRAIDLATKQGAKAIITDSSQNDVAINRTFYDADPSNDLGVPIQCAACTSGSINNPKATDGDPATEKAYRNEARWNFRATMATKLMAPVVVRLLLAGEKAGDLNGDGKVSLAVYASDESFGRATAADLSSSLEAQKPGAAFVQLMHPRDPDPYTYDWQKDLATLEQGKPDVIVVATFPQLHGAIVAAAQRVPGARLFHFHNMRNQRAIQFAGAAGNLQEGISHVLLDNGQSGETFRRDFEEMGGIPVAFRDAVFYDSAMTVMLAAVMATANLPDPGKVTGEQIRDALLRTSDPTGAPVGAGASDFATAIGHIRANRAINYEGASGPMDYDGNLNVRNRIAHFRIDGARTVDVAKYDCVRNDDCPLQPN